MISGDQSKCASAGDVLAQQDERLTCRPVDLEQAVQQLIPMPAEDAVALIQYVSHLCEEKARHYEELCTDIHNSHACNVPLVLPNVGEGTCMAALAPNQVLPDMCVLRGPLALYESLVASGKLREDEEQRYGSVGCGKTMSMDIFHSSLQDNAALRVQRKHFHEFLYDVQRLLHQIKKEDEQGVQTGLGVQRAGERIAASVDLLCFDEFAVTTIQDEGQLSFAQYLALTKDHV
ncbi:Afg1l [Symbiodinium sp. CCMP2592]|nr:Afg1l [Symbiodinium sp. CCMP2592]